MGSQHGNEMGADRLGQVGGHKPAGGSIGFTPVKRYTEAGTTGSAGHAGARLHTSGKWLTRQ